MCCLLSCLCGKLCLFLFGMIIVVIGAILSYIVYSSASSFKLENLKTTSFNSGSSDGKTYKALSSIFIPMFDIRTSANCMLDITETSSNNCYELKSGAIKTTDVLHL